MSTWLGWLIDWGAPITLLAETPEQVADAQRELARIGIDRPAAQATGGPAQWAAEPGQLREMRFTDFPALAAARAGHTPAGVPGPDVVLDVRMTSEWRSGHIEGAVHIPLYDLPERLAEVPAGAVWVHCSSGYRSTAAASLLANTGREVVVINDKFDRAEAVGVAMAENT